MRLEAGSLGIAGKTNAQPRAVSTRAETAASGAQVHPGAPVGAWVSGFTHGVQISFEAHPSRLRRSFESIARQSLRQTPL
jgi:hypothetical protein